MPVIAGPIIMAVESATRFIRSLKSDLQQLYQILNSDVQQNIVSSSSQVRAWGGGKSRSDSSPGYGIENGVYACDFQQPNQS
jgi:hypothetical protein